MTFLKKRKSVPSLGKGSRPTKQQKFNKGKDVSKNNKKQKKGGDIYEAEDSDPDEVKNVNRYDDVENYEYELPSDFEDEEIDEDTAFTEEDKKLFGSWFGGKEDDKSDGSEDDGEEYDEEYDEEEEGSADELDDLFKDKGGNNDDDSADESDEGDLNKTAKDLRETLRKDRQGKMFNKSVVSETVPESEFNVSAGSAAQLSITDLLNGLGDDKKMVLNKSRKLLERLEDKSKPDDAPLPKNIAERLERKAGYEQTSKEVSKWQTMVKANREAPTVKFTGSHHEVSRPSTIAGVSAALRPETDLETQVNALLKAAGAEDLRAVAEAEEQLALRKLDVKEASERQKRLAKMRSLLFYSEMKAKRLKAIKSKDYHRHLQKDAKRKAVAGEAAGATGVSDPDAAECEALEAEFERAKERMSLRHRNSSQWARRALKRGQFMDDGTKAAIAEQLRLGQELRRKIEGKHGSDSEDGLSGSDDDAGSRGSDATSASEGFSDDDDSSHGGRSERSVRSTLKSLKSAGEDKPKKGLLALPFMARALERQRLEVQHEAEELLKELGGNEAARGDVMEGAEDPAFSAGGRKSFNMNGGSKDQSTGYNLPFGETEGDANGSDSDELEDAQAKLERLNELKESRARNAATTAENDRKPSQKKKSKLEAVPSSAAAAFGGEGGDDDDEKDGQNVFSSGAPVSIKLPASLSSATIPKATAAKTGKTAVASAPGAGSSSEVFVPSKKFSGPKPGYLFTKGPRGLGYYLDPKSSAAVSVGKGAARAAVAPVLPAQGKSAQQRHYQERKGLGERVGVEAFLEEAAVKEASIASAKVKAAAAGNNANKTVAGKTKKNQPTGGDAGGDGDDEDDDESINVLATSQADLVQMAFAGDDVAAEFEAEKAAVIADEGPKIEDPTLVPGWGAWSSQQRNPKWFTKEKEKVQRLREASAAHRQDAGVKHVIISEKWDKKAAKYTASQVPFPFTSAEVYEASMRQPLGRDFNPDKSFRDLTRPAVLKESGVVIQPARYSESVSDELKVMKKKMSRDKVPIAPVVHVSGGVVRPRPGQEKVEKKKKKGKG